MREKFIGGMLTTLADVRVWLFLARESKDGAECPCCGQMVKVYRRTINGAMAHALLLLARGVIDGECDEEGWVHVPTFLCSKTRRVTVRGGDFAKMRYWGLLEKMDEPREDGSNRAGFWRLTTKGAEFISQKIAVPKYALVYNNEVIGFDGDEVNILECLGKKFDYNEIMGT